MAKRQLEFDDTIPKFVVWAVGLCFTIYFAANALYIENHEMETEKASMSQRILMSESTRYAQIAKYYRDEMQVRGLSEAEKARLQLVEREQCRIRNELVDGSEICN